MPHITRTYSSPIDLALGHLPLIDEKDNPALYQELLDIHNAIENLLRRAFLNLGESSELTIASGIITVTGSLHTIDTESDAATDTLHTINGGANDGNLLFLSTENNARDVTITETGNIITPGASIVLDVTVDRVMFKYSISEVKWVVESFSDNS